MARGWESKAVEQQQAELERKHHSSNAPLSADQRARDQKRQGLLLSRTRLVQQLAAAQNPRHQQMLREAITELDKQLSFLE